MENAEKTDFRAGIPIALLADGAILNGRVGDEDAILVRRGEEYFAVGSLCTHYHAALSGGLLVEDTIRCPMHHACFSLRTGQALRAPALDPLSCWRVERGPDKVFVREKLGEVAGLAGDPAGPVGDPARLTGPRSVVIVGGGAAGLAAADRLRRSGYSGSITICSADDSPPYDRPNLSKDYLTGTAPADWMPLRAPDYYADRHIDLVLNERVVSLDAGRHVVRLGNGAEVGYGALLLATGAEPVRLQVPVTAGARVFYLRTFSDARDIIAAAESAKSAVVVGASFIALEVAASLRARSIDVRVVAPERIPFEKVLGADVGTFLRELHESHGVSFHLGKSVRRIDGPQVTLSDGARLPADLVVLGVGVRPSVELASAAGLAVDRGISVNQYLQTSAPDVFAAGDIARWPDPHSGDRIRVEHWVVAERQGQIAACNILGGRQSFDAVPFFWSQHYDLTINYVGHAEQWDSTTVEGSLESHDCAITYRRGDRTLAVATIARDLQSLRAECALEADRR